MRTVLANDPSSVKLSGDILTEGGSIVYPTDTLYGIGASILRPDAIKRTFGLKEMEPAPQSLIMSDLAMAEEYVELSDIARMFFGFFPAGAFTFLLPLKEPHNDQVPPVLVKDGKVGIRVPLHSFPRQLVKTIGPITSTSANIHGDVSPKEFKDVRLSGANLYVDDGACLYGGPSTILTEQNGKLRILREGALEEAVLRQFMGDAIG